MKIVCTNRQARSVGNQLWTSGSVGVTVDFEFSEHWNNLNKTVVFKGSGTTKDVVLTGNSCVIPHEVMANYGGFLIIGVYGFKTVNNVNEIVIPTVYVNLGKIEAGANPSGDESLPVTPTVAEQIQAIAQSVRDDADNGVFNGADGADGQNGQDGVSCTHSWNGTILTVTSASGTSSANLKGETGERGETGADGYTPVKGVDYWTSSDKTAIVEDTATALQPSLNEKVDKITGKQLSTNDYDNTAKTKIDAIPADPKYTDTVYDDTTVMGDISALYTAMDGKVDAESGKGLSTNDYTDTAKAKVDAIPANPKYTDTINTITYSYAQATYANIRTAVNAGKNVIVEYEYERGKFINLTLYSFSPNSYYIFYSYADETKSFLFLTITASGKTFGQTPVITEGVATKIYPYASVSGLSTIKADLDAGKEVIIAYSVNGTTYYLKMVRYLNSTDWQDCEFGCTYSGEIADVQYHLYMGSDGSKSIWTTYSQRPKTWKRKAMITEYGTGEYTVDLADLTELYMQWSVTSSASASGIVKGYYGTSTSNYVNLAKASSGTAKKYYKVHLAEAPDGFETLSFSSGSLLSSMVTAASNGYCVSSDKKMSDIFKIVFPFTADSVTQFNMSIFAR